MRRSRATRTLLTTLALVLAVVWAFVAATREREG